MVSMNDDLVVEFNPSAFKHGISEADIRYALDNSVYDGMVDSREEDSEGKNLLIGFSRNAIPLEILYNIIDENTISVFHADVCGKEYKFLLNQRRRYG
jgi:hypothetical protein